MDVLIVMCLGVVFGRFLMPNHLKNANERIALTCTFVLIFSMGIMLGKKEQLLQELSSLGISSLLFFLIPTGLSIVIVFLLTNKLMKKKKKTDTGEDENI